MFYLTSKKLHLTARIKVISQANIVIYKENDRLTKSFLTNF